MLHSGTHPEMFFIMAGNPEVSGCVLIRLAGPTNMKENNESSNRMPPYKMFVEDSSLCILSQTFPYQSSKLTVSTLSPGVDDLILLACHFSLLNCVRNRFFF